MAPQWQPSDPGGWGALRRLKMLVLSWGPRAAKQTTNRMELGCRAGRCSKSSSSSPCIPSVTAAPDSRYLSMDWQVDGGLENARVGARLLRFGAEQEPLGKLDGPACVVPVPVVPPCAWPQKKRGGEPGTDDRLRTPAVAFLQGRNPRLATGPCGCNHQSRCQSGFDQPHALGSSWSRRGLGSPGRGGYALAACPKCPAGGLPLSRLEGEGGGLTWRDWQVKARAVRYRWRLERPLMANTPHQQKDHHPRVLNRSTSAG